MLREKTRNYTWRPFLLGVWFILVTIPLIILHSNKLVALPAADLNPEGIKGPESEDWKLVHILAEGCPCSGTTGRYLIDRGSTEDGYLEEAWIVGKDDQLGQKLRASGFKIKVVEGETLANQYGIHGGPWLLSIDPDGQVRYSGGYAPTRPRSHNEFQDISIIKSLIAGEARDAYPAFGCATSAWLKETMDPIGIKYGQ